jgi:hypothetical protein
MLRVIMLCVIMLSVVILNVVAPILTDDGKMNFFLSRFKVLFKLSKDLHNRGHRSVG